MTRIASESDMAQLAGSLESVSTVWFLIQPPPFYTYKVSLCAAALKDSIETSLPLFLTKGLLLICCAFPELTCLSFRWLLKLTDTSFALTSRSRSSFCILY
ncbi:hypothetical protein FGO68_gene12430 [Halteria grandinella]|uniref:Uncharacterized protein n=1 Tax=Halteria grandinella TaxID=5974 RepID=A0A8J8PA20_HALGN|nr:hypothetical protein FGO68_gene12430 [Halteria grandinella]